MSQTARRDKQKKRKNFQMWLQILKQVNKEAEGKQKSNGSTNTKLQQSRLWFISHQKHFDIQPTI